MLLIFNGTGQEALGLVYDDDYDKRDQRVSYIYEMHIVLISTDFITDFVALLRVATILFTFENVLPSAANLGVLPAFPR